MQSIVRIILDVLFPPSAEARVVQNLVHQGGVDKLFSPHHYRGTTALTQYKNPTVRALIHEAKFHHSEAALTILAQLLARHLTSLHSTPQTLIVPIPLSRQRLRERGYNQVTEIARRALTNDTRFVLAEKILLRTSHTAPQTTRARRERLVNVQHAFSVDTSAHITGKHIIILDDVVTTGATFDAATAAILPHKPASLLRLAIAH